MWTVFEWIPRTLIGFLAPVGGAHGVDLAGFALGQVKVLSRKVHSRSLSSIHILYHHTAKNVRLVTSLVTSPSLVVWLRA